MAPGLCVQSLIISDSWLEAEKKNRIHVPVKIICTTGKGVADKKLLQ